MKTAMTNSAIQAAEEARSFGWTAKRGIALVRGSGAVVWDAEGNSYIDCAAGNGMALLGHCHPAIAEAVSGQARRLITCADAFANDIRAELLAELSARLPGSPERLFLCNSGTEAVEAALKIARALTGRPGVVAALRGFHGRTFGALSATGTKKYRDPFEPLVPGFSHVPYDDIDAMKAAVDGQTAAVILEIIQGEGGVRPGSKDYFHETLSLCREQGTLLIIDEVQTGFGRSGRMFACESVDLVPDLICLGKGIAGGLPMGAVAARSGIGPLPPGSHGSTFGGNPLVCAASLAALKEYGRDGFLDGAKAVGEGMLEALGKLDSPLIREVRGRGMMIGIDLRIRVTNLLKALQERGILAMPGGPTVLRLLPPLVLTQEQGERVVEAVADVLREAEPEGGDNA